VEVRETAKILNLASALAALVAPAAAAPPIADAAGSDGAQIATETEQGIQAKAETELPGDTELMSFTVHRTSDGMLFPQHQSHSSHSSHSSHVSHASSSPGSGGGYWPNPIYTPPIYGPPVVAPPPLPPPAATTSPTTAPPAAAADPMYLACTRASNGFGVNDIASELGQVFGMPESEAVSVAQQALASVLVGGPPCDAYLGD
jgi:hypothetical protein